MSAKQTKKGIKEDQGRKPKTAGVRLEQPIATALYAKLGRLGYTS